MSLQLQPAGLLPNPLSVGRHPEVYTRRMLLRDGAPITLRPIRADDERLLVEFHESLREWTVQHRYFGRFPLERRIAHDRLQQVCTCDCDRDIVVVAERDRGPRGPQLIGVGRLTKTHLAGEAELSLVVEDDFQNVGVGTALLELLVEIARAEGLSRISGRMPADDSAMRHVAQAAGFRLKFRSAAQEWAAELQLL